ncbi:RNA polymerase sigma factor [Streptomyces mirabilis]|uniref:Sigma-70 family RNA polymerase sigma factor n=1 Tax=Streptomyces mirabilis TaxID=68239 RepID=A0ABU3V5E0_9ACTN|nr:sigma-70 family RNA polymerase sigma factor [Streptomyces mirabilis]MCX5355673.1 sigma-70 family RNA polymerase sigma factor [Streptomyces mirabilis]MDU9001318.1 sigma-70 family RNA polymerase sigma factor [Streptomyces mirabilis]
MEPHAQEPPEWPRQRGGGRRTAQAGDTQALEAVVAECLSLVCNIVGRALNCHADVDDVVQEALLHVVRGLPTLRDPGAFRSWLVAITIRQVQDRLGLRAAARERDTDLRDADTSADSAWTSPDSPSCASA